MISPCTPQGGGGVDARTHIPILDIILLLSFFVCSLLLYTTAATEPSNRSQNAVREATKEQQSCTPPTAKKQFISTEKKQSIGEGI